MKSNNKKPTGGELADASGSAGSPRFLGFSLMIEGREGMVTDENPDEVYIESVPFTGWIEKPEFFERIGKDAAGHYLAPNHTLANPHAE